MTPPTTLSSLAVGHRVLHAARLPATGGWGPLVDDFVFDASLVIEAMAPEVNRAKVRLNIPVTGADVWRWQEAVALDDQIAVVSAEADPADRAVLFAGFVSDVAWGFDASDENCTITAVSRAFRLLKDVLVFGRHMVAKDEGLAHYSGLRCEFNAGGRPNRHPTPQTGLRPLGCDFYAGPGRDKGTVPVFTYDGDPTAEWWTVADIFEYLMWAYNADQAWLVNAEQAEADFGRTGPLSVATEGLGLWEAMGAVADRAGYDVWETVTNDGEGLPSTGIAIQRKGTGPARAIMHQAPTAAGLAKLDPELTNLFAVKIAESSTSCVTMPVVAGGARLYEITVPLQRAWDPDMLEVPAGSRIVLPVGGKTPHYAMQEAYCLRYVVEGWQFFGDYADAGRLWDANPDGKYSAAPQSCTVPDMAVLVGEAAGSWPVMPYAPLPCLTRAGTRADYPSVGVHVEYAMDGGTRWYPLAGFEVVPGRLGIRLTMENLAGLVRPADPVKPYPDPADWNLFSLLVNWPSYVHLRMTVTVSGPDRDVVIPDRRVSAGTVFGQKAWFDRAAVGQWRQRAASSVFSGGGLPADEADGAEIGRIAAEVQDAAEDRLVEATIPIEWPDEPIYLGDVIERIEGLGYDLRTNTGPRKRSPRVVGRTLHLTAGTHSMSLQLDTWRGAGLI